MIFLQNGLDQNHQREPTGQSFTCLTIGEASSMMLEHRCRYSSNRKVQRMCRDGVVDCEKITTTRDGNPVTEWLVNEASLLKHIEENEPKWDGDASQNIAVATGDANSGFRPMHDFGNASLESQSAKEPGTSPDFMSTSNQSGDATGVSKFSKSIENTADDTALPDVDGDAVGETRRLADVLIDNAKLTAELAGARELVASISDERQFLREELKVARAGRKDVTAIAQRMLETLETIAVGGKLMPITSEMDASHNSREAHSNYADVAPLATSPIVEPIGNVPPKVFGTDQVEVASNHVLPERQQQDGQTVISPPSEHPAEHSNPSPQTEPQTVATNQPMPIISQQQGGDNPTDPYAHLRI